MSVTIDKSARFIFVARRGNQTVAYLRWTRANVRLPEKAVILHAYGGRCMNGTYFTADDAQELVNRVDVLDIVVYEELA